MKEYNFPELTPLTEKETYSKSIVKSLSKLAVEFNDTYSDKLKALVFEFNLVSKPFIKYEFRVYQVGGGLTTTLFYVEIPNDGNMKSFLFDGEPILIFDSCPDYEFSSVEEMETILQTLINSDKWIDILRRLYHR